MTTATLLPLLPDPETWLDVPCASDPDTWVDVTTPEQASRAAAGCQACPLLDACRRFAREAPPWSVAVVLAGELHAAVEVPEIRARQPRTGGLYGRLYCDNPAAHSLPVLMNREGDRYVCRRCFKRVKNVEQVLPPTMPRRIFVRPATQRGMQTLDQLRARLTWEM